MATKLKGLVLSGGKGTRLRPLTYSMPKQLVPVANQPILLYVMNSMVDAGITDIGVIISPETGDQIKATLNAWQPQGIELTYILQDSPAGLAHALKIAQPFVGDCPLVMYLGDNLIQDPLAPLIEAFESQQADAAIWLKQVDNPQAFGVAVLDEVTQQVKQLVEKPKEPPSNLALVGVYLFQPSIFKAVNAIQPSPRGELEITDAIQWLVQNQYKVCAQQMQGWWLDTGKKDDLLAANQIVLESFCQAKIQGSIQNTNISGKVEIGKGAQLVGGQVVGPARIGENALLVNVKVGPNTSIASGCQLKNITVDNSVVLENAQIENIPGRITQSLIGQNCQLIHDAQVLGQPIHRLMIGDENQWVNTYG